MATITIDCTSAQYATIKSASVGPVQIAEILFSPSGTYDRSASESIELTNADLAIKNSRRTQKTVTILNVMGAQSAYDGTAKKHYHVKGAAVNAGVLDCTIFEVGGSELADGTIPTLNQPLSVMVAFTEA